MKICLSRQIIKKKKQIVVEYRHLNVKHSLRSWGRVGGRAAASTAPGALHQGVGLPSAADPGRVHLRGGARRQDHVHK